MRRISFIFMILLTLWVVHAAVRIEILNAQSGYYLPRKDRGTDGKWRQSLRNTPRDKLRAWVGGPGLLQYVLSPALLVLSFYHFTLKKPVSYRGAAGLCGICCLVCMFLIFYRGYFSSLGW